MKKQIKLLGAFLLSSMLGFSQAALPTSENFDLFNGSFTQIGWTFNNVAGVAFTYPTGGVGGTPAGKLDAAGEYVQVFVGGQMGAVVYNLKGNNTGGAFSGTFDVQESPDGTTWTTLFSHVNNLNTTTMTQYTVTPAAASRYLRFNFTVKATGNNVGIDNVSIAAGVPTVQDINMKYNTTSILTGGTTPIFSSPVATPVPVNFTIENLGLTLLNVSNITITGTAAADYSLNVPTVPTTVGAQANIPLTVTFVPSVAGTRDAVMTITNDDPDEGTYIINLYGVGGNSATEPTTTTSALSFTNVKSYRMNFSYTVSGGTNPDGYIVLRKTSTSAITDVPVDGTTYTKGDMIGTSKVFYIGSLTSHVANEIYANTQYQFAVFPYNGTGTFTNYKTTGITTGTNTSSGSMMPAIEYTGITTSSPTFLTDLSARIYPHQSTFYSFYDETMIRMFSARDTVAGQQYITCVYSGEKYLYTGALVWGYMSREHSYCHNWMPTNPADGTGAAPNNVERKEYNDQHHLFPTNQNSVNAQRSNRPMGVVVTQQGSYLGCKWGLDALGNLVFEPRNEHKGDFARAVMYMATCYNGQLDAFGAAQNWKFRNPISATIPYGQDQNVLKAWHYQDPPDAYEIARNDFLDSLQGNRNPFIDSMQFACFIDFSNMTQITGASAPCGSFIGLKDKSPTSVDFAVFPNPSTGTFSVLLNAEMATNYTIHVIDVTGRIIETQSVKAKQGGNYISFANKTLPAGAYIIEISSATTKSVKKLIVQ